MNRLKELREERGLSVRDMENITGINHSSISLYELEKREPNISMLKRLSNFFEVTIDYLICNNNYCIYAKYKESNLLFSIKSDYYEELKKDKFIYFDNKNNRCIDVNTLIGVTPSTNLTELFIEFSRIDKMDALFEKKTINDTDLESIQNDIMEIELTRGLVKKIKDAIQ